MLDCRQLVRMVASDELSDAPWRTRLNVKLHVFMCRHCRRYMAQLRDLDRSAKRAYRVAEDPRTVEGLESQILEQLFSRPDIKDLSGEGKDRK